MCFSGSLFGLFFLILVNKLNRLLARCYVNMHICAYTGPDFLILKCLQSIRKILLTKLQYSLVSTFFSHNRQYQKSTFRGRVDTFTESPFKCFIKALVWLLTNLILMFLF